MNVIHWTFALTAMITCTSAAAEDVYTFNDWAVHGTPAEESRVRTGSKNETKVAICRMENWSGSYGIVAYKIIGKFEPLNVEFRKKLSIISLFDAYDWSALKDEENEIVFKVDANERNLLLDRNNGTAVAKLTPSIDYGDGDVENFDVDDFLSDESLLKDTNETSKQSEDLLGGLFGAERLTLLHHGKPLMELNARSAKDAFDAFQRCIQQEGRL